jgi:hypothetical protein
MLRARSDCLIEAINRRRSDSGADMEVIRYSVRTIWCTEDKVP